ncbi:MAG: bifunctional 5,10-methylenetetrahydrofolate dehydrogenase/5,10-methenyltetrahydrofolate cyclohydrolase [Acidobacteriota bacterium]|jgi:methylenetetrahydrofolate dehydrogenase (NADP+)/methenyltetrahydrofolate cyclohydrolase|nr:bifunctional 5,10-methylenetetrahydrofolate dehydrogenase/5,10-methenyltetrahydrofolate cyclohydrolase [Acidobacteriota bacterium]HNQ80057.1 bifunctional 5,10-methylenetetrahydrofolate dehydrogenase/5,10-methenyltetrahydrofolate cyclohydrolase [Candidatus Aminicenantes bacterium]MDD8009742.1 bifunctional 5,10-methylenetetrahydrofolate dehydrogenase/5,10-methenyltetrahydrofolate cyclohydrolase [Acidobacteriota bacterium]MDD8032589.1 bifunctional 5,10-methylenetetrahydrofolate dehydrogenase/5,1
MGVWLEGKPPADRVREFVKSEARRLREATGAVPGLTAVLVGDNKSSLSYVRTKEKACQALGLNGSVIHLPAETTMDALHDRIRALNDDDAVDGILVQLPLPPQLRTNEVIGWIRPDKDVDGIHPASLGLLLQNQPGLRPCTPMGVLELIRETGAAIEGRDAVIIGRSLIVGKPLAALLTNANATVTICHSKTRDLAGTAARADILVAAMGKAAFVTREFVKPGALVIDVGTSAVSDPETVRTLFGDDPLRAKDLADKGYTLVGDVDPRVIDKAGWLTPVPKGVGPLTIAMLMKNTLEAFKLRRKLG